MVSSQTDLLIQTVNNEANRLGDAVQHEVLVTAKQTRREQAHRNILADGLGMARDKRASFGVTKLILNHGTN